MDRTPNEEGKRLFERAVDALGGGETASALAFLERALKLDDNPSWYSYLGYCVAKERGQVKKGADLCQESLKLEPANPAHHLNLAKVQLVAGQKVAALKTLRDGMAVGGHPEILNLLNRLGTRKRSVLPFLSRDNPLNKYLGLVLSKLHLR